MNVNNVKCNSSYYLFFFQINYIYSYKKGTRQSKMKHRNICTFGVYIELNKLLTVDFLELYKMLVNRHSLTDNSITL